MIIAPSAVREEKGSSSSWISGQSSADRVPILRKFVAGDGVCLSILTFRHSAGRFQVGILVARWDGAGLGQASFWRRWCAGSNPGGRAAVGCAELRKGVREFDRKTGAVDVAAGARPHPAGSWVIIVNSASPAASGNARPVWISDEGDPGWGTDRYEVDTSAEWAKLGWCRRSALGRVQSAPGESSRPGTARLRGS